MEDINKNKDLYKYVMFYGNLDFNHLSKSMVPILIKDGTVKNVDEFNDLMIAIEVAEILCPDEEIK